MANKYLDETGVTYLWTKIKEQDCKPLYNLGYYDTITSNSDGTYTITRQTGYTTIEASNILSTFTSGGSKVFAAETNIILPNAVTDWNQEFGTSNIGYQVRSLDGSWIFDKTIGGIGGQSVKIANNDFTTIDQFKALCPINIQYKMTTSYTEEIIEGQPLITLDQQGSQWLRSEWEKGLNLFSGGVSLMDKGLVVGKQYIITTKNNTRYNFKIATFPSATAGSSELLNNKDNTSTFIFTWNTNKNWNLYVWDTNWVLQNNDDIAIMLNEGSIALPYQPYSSKAHITNYEADFLKDESLKSANIFNIDAINPNKTNYVKKISDTEFKATWSAYVLFKTNFKENTQYTISGYVKDDAANHGGRLVIFYTDNTSEECFVYYGTSYVYKTYTSKANKTINYIGYSYETGDYYSYYKNLMINEGTIALPYQPYNQNKHITNNEAEFLKTESDRSANLFNNPYNYSATNNGVSINVVGNECVLNGTSTNGFYQNLGSVTLKAGTYTYNQIILSGSINGNISLVKFGLYQSGDLFPLGELTGTYTLTQDTTISIVVWFGSAGFTFNNCKLAYMLNEGSTPLPYQPYEGKVVHEKELENAKNEINNSIATKQDKLVSGTNIKTINGNSIVGSGDLTVTADSVFTEVTDVVDTFTINRNGTWLITCLGYNKIYASDNSSISFYGSALVSMTSAGSDPHICINGTAYACSSAITFVTSGILQVYKKAN